MTTTNPTPTQQETLQPPRWTVCYNIVSTESNAWVGTGWEFFNDEKEAEACYKRHQRLGNVPTKRPFYNPVDIEHLGVVDRKRFDSRRAALAGPRGDLGLDTNFPLSETLKLLVEWAQHLHVSHECDCDGWEQRSFLIEAAQRYQREIVQAAATSSPAPAESVAGFAFICNEARDVIKCNRCGTRFWADLKGAFRINHTCESLTTPAERTEVAGEQEIGPLQLYDRADGVKGHFCVGRKVTGCGFDYNEFWNKNKFCSAGEVFIGKEAAEAKLNELSRLSDSARRAGEEIVKAWLWHTHERDQERALESVTAIISKHFTATSDTTRRAAAEAAAAIDALLADRLTQEDYFAHVPPIQQMAEIIREHISKHAVARPDNEAESVALIIPTCGDCPFVDHSGAFTPGGAKDICGHRDAADHFAPFVGPGNELEHYHWKHRIVNREAAPPAQCPLRATTTKGYR